MAGRDAHGRFAKGNKGGPGRPKRSKEDKYLRTMQKCVRIRDWKEITLTAIARAKAGDVKARQWLSDYMLGKPPSRHEITGAEGRPIEIDHVHEVRSDLERKLREAVDAQPEEGVSEQPE